MESHVIQARLLLAQFIFGNFTIGDVCSNRTYTKYLVRFITQWKFYNQIGENDKVFEDNNVKIAVEKKSFLYLAGTILEFSGGLNGKGFVFNNPNASRTCGCGESFSL